MIEANDIIDMCPRDKQDEVYAVTKFLNNLKVSFEFTLSNIEIYPDEPADIWVKDINRKFQVVVADFQLHELLGKARTDSSGLKVVSTTRNKEDTWREYILKPIDKKRKYGKAANGITLLLNSPLNPPWIEKDIRILRAAGCNRELKGVGFDEIYLVLKDKNIQIYP